MPRIGRSDHPIVRASPGFPGACNVWSGRASNDDLYERPITEIQSFMGTQDAAKSGCDMHDDRFFVSDDKAMLDLDVIHGFLQTCYWSPGIPRETVERAIKGSLCFGVYEIGVEGQGQTQVGFARVISDHATYAYLCDVFIVESHRGRGLSCRLMEAILEHPDLQGLRRFALMTRDAHGLYDKFGFKHRNDNGKAYLELHNPHVYGGRTGV